MAAPVKLPAGRNGSGTAATPIPVPGPSAPLFSAEALKMQRMMRFNPLPLLNPANLGQWHDQFEAGMLRMAALIWDAMCKRDDTLVTVKPQLENAVASQDWGVFPIKDADPVEAERHKACLDYFYDHLIATDAFDRNERGGRDKLIEQMMRADSFVYAVHHIVWRPQPGKTVAVQQESKRRTPNAERPIPNKEKPAAEQVPVISAELEFVPLWFFENTTGRLRLLKDGGFGVEGEPLERYGDWIITTGRGLMLSAAGCYTMKRLSFQDWTNFMERYANGKVVLQTPAQKETEAGRAAKAIAEAFGEGEGIIFYESQPGAEKPIWILGPEGTQSVDIFAKFIERQDAKMSSMYRGNDLSMMSRAGEHGEKRIGASLQQQEGDAMEKGACRRVGATLNEYIDRRVIELCFGPGVEPQAYFGLSDADVEDTAELRESVKFLISHGCEIDKHEIAERLGVQLVEGGEEADLLIPPAPVLDPGEEEENAESANGRSRRGDRTANAARRDRDLENFLGPHLEDYRRAFSDDMIALRLAIEHVVESPSPELQTANARALRQLLPGMLEEINRAPRTATVLTEIMKKAFERGAAGGRS